MSVKLILFFIYVFGEVSISMVVTNKAAKHIENHLLTYRKQSLIFTNHIKGLSHEVF
jgi:hypothetical protein